MKKIICLVLALVLCTALATPAMAIRDNYEGKWINVNSTTKVSISSTQTAYYFCFKDSSSGSVDIMVYKVSKIGDISKIQISERPKNVVGTVDSAKIPQVALAEAAKDYPEFFSTGSTLSEGSWWIISGIAVIAVAGVAALVIVKKKKKPALASGADNSNEE